MSTAKWWWDEQVSGQTSKLIIYENAYRHQEKLRKAGKRDATIASLIVASDQTTLSIMCGGQTAYPVYLTLGNISKDWRRKPSKRAMVLLGYLPVDSFEDVFDDNERQRLKADLVHRSMEMLLAPIKQASEEGVEMWCPDGRLRRIFPRIAAYLADWPEQCLMACTKQSSCPICTTKRQGRGDLTQTAPPRDRDEMLAAWRSYFENEDIRELEDLSLTPVWPWWKDLPDVNLSSCITPDMLHQLYQGLFKTHLVRWLRYLVGTDTLDERFASMPGAEGMIRFPKGISAVKQWTGRESKEMASQILPMVVGELTPEVSKMVRSIVDFIFRAHASSMTDSDLVDLENDLQTFHQLKDLLVAKGFYQSDARFDKIPKLHMLSHYADSIRALGTPDGYNTEAPEHLHIEYAKVPWRASNKVRPLKQMLTYIQRQEAIRIHRAHLDRYLGNDLYPEDERTVNVEGMDDTDGGYVDCVELDEDVGEEEVEHDAETGPEPVTYPNPRRRVAVNPTKPKVEIKEVIRTYGASDLTSAITNFLTRRLGVSKHDILLSPYNQLQLWHRLYLYHDPLPFAPFDPPRRDVIRASAPVLDERGRVRKEGVWDVALFLERPNQTQSWRSNEEKHGIMRYRAGRVRTFFTLPGHLQHHYLGQLAYVEVFSAFDASVSPFARMHCTQPDFDSRNRRRTLVIPVTEIALACHLAPKFHLLDPELRLTPQTDLFAISKNFWFNHYYNHYLFKLVQHWWRRRPGIFARLATLPGV
ncbi:hypothetical protein FRC12_012665 [Ceratobasidium sp. 428]|nr:hypothetical protein FRC12_012665 [Ceratobasidium sp. 428]